MKKVALLLFVLIFVLTLRAGIVDTTVARQVAQNFLSSHFPKLKSSGLEFVIMRKHLSYPFYIFRVHEGKGFVIVSSQSELYPILAYSDESDFPINGNMPLALKAWLDSVAVITLAAREGKIKQHPLLKIAWNDYITGRISTRKSSTKSVGPLLSTKWNQGKYYNAMCPADVQGPDGHVYTGCVATAMAQVLRYWSYPLFGNSEHSYTHSTYGEQYADFANTHYYWDSMPNYLSTYNDHVAQLMYHCGVAVNMSYSPSGSGAYMSWAHTAMINYFDYSRSATMQYKSAYSEREWDSIMMDQINNLRPVLYAGYGSAGHAFVIDGYQASDTTFHVNWGWGGSYNGWFRLDDLTPGSNNFNTGQQAIINLYPEVGDTTYTELTDEEGTIMDNGESYFYKNNSLNKWLINPPGAHGVMLDFISFRLVPGQDTLYVYAGADETAPLAAVYSQDSVPDDLFVSSGTVLIKFVSDQYNADAGFYIKYNAKARDVGAVYIESPYGSVACGGTEQIKAYVKNFGYETIDTIPVKVIIENGYEQILYDTLYTNLPCNQSDSFIVATYDFSAPGNYTIKVVTELPGDQVAGNDTAITQFNVNPPYTPLVKETFDHLTYEHFNQDWYDPMYRIWLDYNEGGRSSDTNKYITAYVNNYDTLQFYYNHRVLNITNKTFLRFDYRLQDGQTWPPAAAQMDDSSWIAVLVADNCTGGYDTLFVIDTTNYVADTNFITVTVPLDIYQGQEILISFSGFWNPGYAHLNLDNFIIADSLSGNFLTGYTCTSEKVNVQASVVTGGVEPLLFIWQQSTDQQQWTTIDTLFSTGGLSFAKPADIVYLRRIVMDSLGMADTSNVLQVDPQGCVMTLVEVYPNPSDGRFVITNLKPGIIQVVDMSGSLIVNRRVEYSEQELDLYGLRPGVYILRFISGGKTVIKKLIIR